MGVHRRGDHWVWVGGPVPPGSDAITVWRVISVRGSAAANSHLMRHEEAHLDQWRELGVVGFLSRYLGAYARGRLHGYSHRSAYRLIPLEVEAEQAAVDAAPRSEGRSGPWAPRSEGRSGPWAPRSEGRSGPGRAGRGGTGTGDAGPPTVT